MREVPYSVNTFPFALISQSLILEYYVGRFDLIQDAAIVARHPGSAPWGAGWQSMLEGERGSAPWGAGW